MKTAFTLFIICFFSYSSFAQKAGTLDSSFGVNGKVMLQRGECHNAIVLKSDKILALGEPGSFDNKIITLIRFNENGSVDSVFGVNGIVTTKYNPQHYIDCIALAEQVDNKIIVAENEDGNEYANIVLIRYMENGKIDSSFGKNGIAILDLGKGEICTAIKIDRKNRILIAGYRDSWRGENSLLLRCKPDGKLDSAFGINGAVIFDTKLNKIFQQATALTIQSDDKIVTGGRAYNGDVYSNESKFFVARFLENGKNDFSFGKNGIVTAQITRIANDLSSIQVKSDGKILAAGTSSEMGSSTYPYAYTATSLIQFTASGNIDSAFGHNGKIINEIPFYNTFATASVLQTNDELIVAGYVFKRQPQGEGKFMVSRYLSNGFIDTSFGTNGTTITNFTNAQAFSVGLQNDNRIIVAGLNYDYGTDYRYFALARYNNDEVKKDKHYAATHNNAQATSLNNVSIYPNPAQNVLHIAGLLSNTKLTVVDIAGNSKLQVVANASSYNLNIASLNAGNYLLKIEMNDAVVTKKFVKE